jgi:hypothetical protein
VVRGPQARSTSGDCAGPPAPAGHCEIGPVLDFSLTGDDLAVMRADCCPHRSPSVTFRTMLFISLTPLPLCGAFSPSVRRVGSSGVFSIPACTPGRQCTITR